MALPVKPGAFAAAGPVALGVKAKVSTLFLNLNFLATIMEWADNPDESDLAHVALV